MRARGDCVSKRAGGLRVDCVPVRACSAHALLSARVFGTRVRVTNLTNGKTVVVRINDRGPHRQHRVIDLAQGAATELKMISDGEVPVRLEVLP